MAKCVIYSCAAVSKLERICSKSKPGVVILLGLSLALVSPLSLSGQINQQQQEQQQREEQQRQEQAREQQQREQEERDRQAREEQQRQEQQREEQQRQEQAREQQQREQEERDRQAREEQQRQEQQREEQQRQDQAREQEQREQQERDRQAREEQQRQQQQRDELERRQERQRQTSAAPAGSPTVSQSSGNSPVVGATPTIGRDDLRRKPCLKEPCTQPEPKPIAPKPVVPEPITKLCNGHPCPVCAPGQSAEKDNSCVPAAQTKAAAVAPKPPVLAQACPAGQVWNGAQCTPLASPCLAGQTRVGASCQTDCTLATAGAQNYISILRMARQNKDSACLKDPTGHECRSADATYQMRLAEYRNYLGGVPVQCTLQDPSSI